MSLIGKEVKPFTADAYRNGEFIKVTQEDLKGKWSIVFFYPADFSAVCPTELVDMQTNYETLKSIGVEVYSVSTDTHLTHKAWHDADEEIGEIEYAMIGDPTHLISRNFDVFIEEKGQANRGTFIIDPDGIIQAIEINAGLISRDSDVAVNKVKAAHYIRENPNEACPAKWEEGKETIKLGVKLDLKGKI